MSFISPSEGPDFICDSFSLNISSLDPYSNLPWSSSCPVQLRWSFLSFLHPLNVSFLAGKQSLLSTCYFTKLHITLCLALVPDHKCNVTEMAVISTRFLRNHLCLGNLIQTTGLIDALGFWVYPGKQRSKSLYQTSSRKHAPSVQQSQDQDGGHSWLRGFFVRAPWVWKTILMPLLVWQLTAVVQVSFGFLFNSFDSFVFLLGCQWTVLSIIPDRPSIILCKQFLNSRFLLLRWGDWI